MAALTPDAMAIINVLQSNSQSSNSSWTKPAPYDGKTSADAQRFLAQFEAWKEERTDLQAQAGRNNTKAIKAALLLLKETAGNWATQYLIAMAGVNPTWTTWAAFKTDFEARFLSSDEAALAVVQLQALRQKKTESVLEYSAKFQDLCSRTKLEGEAKRIWFLMGLNDECKRLFYLADAGAAVKAVNFVDTVKRATAMDASIHNPMLGLMRGGAAATTGTSAYMGEPMNIGVNQRGTNRNTSVPTRGGTREEFREAMRGNCFRCGGPHRAADDNCPARNAVCRHCEQPGHWDRVCEDKFCGREKGRGRPRERVAANRAAEVYPLPW